MHEINFARADAGRKIYCMQDEPVDARNVYCKMCACMIYFMQARFIVCRYDIKVARHDLAIKVAKCKI